MIVIYQVIIVVKFKLELIYDTYLTTKIRGCLQAFPHYTHRGFLFVDNIKTCIKQPANSTICWTSVCFIAV